MTTGTSTVVETPWRRLDKRMLVVGPLGGLIRLVPVAAILLITGQGDVVRLWIALGVALLIVAAGVVRWRTTRYRITPDRVELHSGWLRRQRRSVPRDRIRTVDLTARLQHRIFGLSVVKVGAGPRLGHREHRAGPRRRQQGRGRPPAPGTAGPLPGHRCSPEHVSEPATAPPPVQELARLNWSWLRFAPLTFSSLAGIGAIGATAFNLFDELGVDPRDIVAVDDAAERIATAPIWLGILRPDGHTARRRGRRVAAAVRRALVRLPPHPGARHRRHGAPQRHAPRQARPAHPALAVGVGAAARGASRSWSRSCCAPAAGRRAAPCPRACPPTRRGARSSRPSRGPRRTGWRQQRCGSTRRRSPRHRCAGIPPPRGSGG